MLVKRFVFGVGIRGLGGAVGFLSNLYIARTLDIESAGHFFSFISLVWLAVPFVLMGGEQSIIRQLSVIDIKQNSKESLDVVYSCILVAMLMLALLSFIVFVINGSFDLDSMIPWELPLNYILFVIGLASVYRLMVEMLRGIGSYYFNSVMTAIYFSLSVILICTFGVIVDKQTFHFIVYLLPFIFTVGILACVTDLWLKGAWKDTSHSTHRKMRIKSDLFKESLSLWITSISTALITFSGSVLLVFVAPAQEVSIFHVSIKIASLILMILSVMNAIYVVKYNRLIADGKIKEAIHLARKVGAICLFVAGPMLIISTAFSDVILSYFGPEYTRGVDCLRVILLGAFISVVSSSSGLILIAMKKGAVSSLILLLTFLLLLGLSLGLKQYGALGFSIAYTVAIAFRESALLFYIQRQTGYLIYPWVSKNDLRMSN